MENNSFGVILSIKFPDVDISKEAVLKAFLEAGIDENMFPKERLPRKALQKALKEAIEGEEGFLIRSVVRKGTTLSSGLVQEHKDKEAKNLKYNVHNVITLDSNTETIQSKTDFRTESIRESYKDYRNKLGASEIMHRVKEILFVSMAIDILCDKCYFIPAKFQPNIDKIIKLAEILKKLGAAINVGVVGVDASGQTRNTIVQEFTYQTLSALQKEIEFCIDQRKKFEQGYIKYLRPTAFRKQQHKIKILDQRIRTYVVLLALTPEEDGPILAKLETLDTELSKNIEIAETTCGRRKRLPRLPMP